MNNDDIIHLNNNNGMSKFRKHYKIAGRGSYIIYRVKGSSISILLYWTAIRGSLLVEEISD